MQLRFPPTVEIKRVIAAAARAGIQIGSIEIHPRGITIHVKDPAEKDGPQVSDYDLWKMSQRLDTDRVRHKSGKTDALPKNAENSNS